MYHLCNRAEARNLTKSNTLPWVFFSRFLNRTNATKSRKASLVPSSNKIERLGLKVFLKLWNVQRMLWGSSRGLRNLFYDVAKIPKNWIQGLLLSKQRQTEGEWVSNNCSWYKLSFKLSSRLRWMVICRFKWLVYSNLSFWMPGGSSEIWVKVLSLQIF